MRLDPHTFGESVLLAVSGGADSMVMADMVIRGAIPAIPRDRITIAHCNFHLRGQESDQDAAFVQQWAEHWGVRWQKADFDTAAAAARWDVSIEMAARRLRYEWFDALCHQYGCKGVCVAHNANDNAETLILNLVRGTGLKGLCGMAEQASNPYGDTLVFRPMLGFTRAQIEDYAGRNAIEYRTDSTNLESQYKRNLVRNELFPLLERLNPSVLATLTEDISHFSQAQAMVKEYLSNSCGELTTVLESGEVHVDLNKLTSSPHWELNLYEILSRYGFNSSVISQIKKLLMDEHAIVSGHIFRSADHVLVTSSNLLIIRDVSLSPEVNLRVELLPWDSTMNPRTERGVLLVDADCLGSAPQIRKWRDGDWLQPLGMKGKKKVSDMLTDLKYDILKKENVYVLEGSGSHVLALLGERIDDSVKITSSTTRVYRISIS